MHMHWVVMLALFSAVLHYIAKHRTELHCIVMVKAQCLWDVAIKINSSINSTNVLVANLKPLYWALWPRCMVAGFTPVLNLPKKK